MPRNMNNVSKTDMNCGPIGFWFLNDELNYDTICKQLDYFLEQHFAGVVLHPRDGLLIPYLSQSWFKALTQIQEQCRCRGLQAWFYDENPYPSGQAGGLLVDKYPHLAADSLNFHDQIYSPRNDLLQACFPGIAGLFRVYAAPVDSSEKLCGSFADITHWAGLIGDNWFVQGERNMGYGPVFTNDSSSQPHWRAWQQQNIWALNWPTTGSHNYRIIVVYRRSGNSNPAMRKYVDLLNSETTERFIELTFKKTESQIGLDRFREFFAAFTDEPHLNGPYPWTESLPMDYQHEYNEDILAMLPHLVIDIDRQSQLVRYRYRRLLAKLFVNRFVKPLANYCKHVQLPLTGHISPEEDPIMQPLGIPGLTQSIAQMDWPGYDLILSPFGKAELSKLLGPKTVSSVGNQCGKKHLMAEVLGCCGENLTIDSMYRIINWIAVCGFDKFVIHGQFMSLDGQRKREAPPSIFYHAPYWRNFHKFSDYISMLSMWNGKGTPVRPIAVLFPNSAFEAWVLVETHRAIALAQDIAQLNGSLMAAGLDFDLLSDYDLSTAKITATNGHPSLQIGRALYQTIVIPNVPILDENTHSLLAMCKNAGVEILSETASISTIGVEMSSKSYVDYQLTKQQISERLCEEYRLWASFPTDRRLYVQTRNMGGRIERMIYNPDEQALWLTLNSPDLKPLDEFSPSALVKHLPRASQIKIEPYQLLILTEKLEDNIVPVSFKFSENKMANWRDDWSLEPNELNTLVLTNWKLELPDGTNHNVRLPTRSGLLPWGLIGQTIRLNCQFIVDDVIENAQLWWERGTFNGNYEIRLNNQILTKIEHLSVHDIHERRVLITSLLKKGVNSIDIQVGPISSNQPAILDPLRINGYFKVIRTDDSENNVADVRPDWYKNFLVDDSTLVRIAPFQGQLNIKNPIDWTSLGFPQYSGMMTYKGILVCDNVAKPCFLEAGPDQTDSFEVIVNGSSAGVCCWKPFRIEITEFVHVGENVIEIKVSNTSINRMQGKPQPSGLLSLPNIVNLHIEPCQTIERPILKVPLSERVLQKSGSAI